MMTIHVYKTDGLGASRVMLQSEWEGTRSAFVHIAATGRAPGLLPEFPYGLIGLCRALAAARAGPAPTIVFHAQSSLPRSEEHTSELQSLMRISYAVFCLKKKQIQHKQTNKKMLNYNTQ